MDTISSRVSELILVTWRGGRDEEAEKWTVRRGAVVMDALGDSRRPVDLAMGEEEGVRARAVLQNEEADPTAVAGSRHDRSGPPAAARAASVVAASARMLWQALGKLVGAARHRNVIVVVEMSRECGKLAN